MGLKEIYSGIEEKYYNFMDGLDKTGIPVYKVIDFFESKNIPSFPLFTVFILLLIGGTAFLLTGGAGLIETTTQFELTVKEGSIPLEEASLTYTFKEEEKTVKTDDKGKAVLEVIAGKDFTVTAEKTGYKKKAETFNTSKEKKGIIVLVSSLLEPIKVQLLGKGNELLTEEITVRFNCTENFEWNETITISTGTAELNEVPVDCGTIMAVPQGKECEECDFSSDTSLIKIYLDEVKTEKGVINFFVEDDTGNLLDGIEVLVIPVGSTVEEDSCPTYNGSCYTQVPFGEYYIRATDYAGNWRDYDSRGKAENVRVNSSNQNIDFETIILEEGVIGEIKIRVINSEGNAIENALVKLFKDETKIREQRTDSAGETILNVAEQIDYTVSAIHADYLNSGSRTVSPRTEYYEIILDEATASNKRAINVSVVDEKGQPVENTKCFLKDASTLNIVGEEKITGFDGKAVFERIKEGEYIVRAEKKGFEGKDSRRIIVREKEPQNVTITLNIGEGTLNVTVVDRERQPIQAAKIKVIDYFSGEEYAIYSTDTEGKKSFAIRADKKVFLEVSESAHSNYISAPIQMFDGTEEKTIVLEDSIDFFQIKLEELKIEGQRLEDEVVSQGKTYKAIFKLMIPKGVISEEAGAHIRTGADTKNQNNTMEKDDLYIKKVSAANAKIIKGTTFNPNTGYGIDSTHLTSGNSKWANVIFNGVQEGTYEITAVIQVREAVSSSDLELAYRGWVIDSGYQRDPFDEELQEAESIGTKEALYAEARHEPLRIGASSLCSENFCTTFTAKDIANATRTNIIDSFPAEISSDYELEFNIISISEKQYTNSELVIEGKSLKLNSYEIEGEKKNAGNKIIIPIGTISKGEKISGKVNFTTKSEGTNRIDFSLFGESLNLGKEKILFKPIRAEVALARNMAIVTTPKNLVPFIKNNLLVKITDDGENDLSEVTVKIEKDSETIAIGKTDSKGIYAYSFEPLNAGTEIIITAEKSGFNPVEKTINVSTNIVSVMPLEIHESFNAKKPIRRVTRDITLKNTTEMPLTIRDVELTDAFKELIDAEIPAYAGTDLLIGSEEQILVNLGLTEKGRQVTATTSVNGEIIIVFENLDAEKQWTASVPLKITIGLGGEVDSTDCFSVAPNAWNALTQRNTRETKLVLNNSCTVEGENIALKKVKAKVIWKENAIGDFDLTSTIEGAQTITLKNTYQLLAETFNPHTGEEENLELRFLPDSIPLGAGTATIYLEAVNPTESGEEKLKQKITVNVQISELSTCLRITPANNQLRIQMNYYNQGWGYMNQYMGSNPMQTFPYLMNPNTLTSMNRNFPYWSYPYDPNASPGSVRNNRNVVAAPDWRSQQFPSTQYMGQFMNPTAYNQGLDFQFNFSPPGKGLIELRNDCPSQVQVEFEPAPEISVSNSTVILEQGGSKTIEVTPSMFIGQYQLIVRGKHKDSTDVPTEIARYNVLVESEFMRNYFDCITLSPRVFTFNDLIADPVEGIVWNTCYDQGVILHQNSIPTSFDGTGGDYGFPSQQDTGKKRLDSSGIIKSIQIYPISNKPGPDGKIVQELRFRLYKNLEYKPKDIQLPDDKNPLVKLANLRIKLTGLYYAVEAEERLPVTFFNRSGMQQTIPFDIIIEDYWALAGQDIIDFGDATISHQACVSPLEGALIFCGNEYKSGTNEKGDFTDDIFVNGIADIDSQKVIYKKTEAKRTDSKGYCGDPDRIARIINNRVEHDSGAVLIFSVDNGDRIKLRIDKREMNCIPKDKKIEGTLLARLSRSNPARTETVSIPYSVCLDIKGLSECTEKPLTPEEEICKDTIEGEKTISERIEEILEDATKSREEKKSEIAELLKEHCPKLSKEERENVAERYIEEFESTTEITKCSEGGYTGPEAYEKYCFEQIKLNWNWDEIDAKECDTEETFCDSAQLGIELVKKAAKIRELGIKEIDDQCYGYCEEGVKNSKNLFRFLINQTRVKDEITGDTLVFFIDKDYSIIAGKKFSEKELTEELRKTGLIAGWLESNLTGNAKTVTKLVDGIIKEMEANSGIDEDSVIGEIDLGKVDSTVLGAGELEKMLGADRVESGSSKYFVTFNEYKEFRNKLKACTEANPNATECPIEKVKNKTSGTTTTITVNLKMMRELQENIEFKVGIRNIKEISEEDKTIVMRLGKVRVKEKLNQLGYETLEDFYNENIEFTSYLKQDGFSAGFNSDFYKAYLNKTNSSSEESVLKEFKSDGWTFKTKNKFETGMHSVLLNYNWYSNKGTEVTITLDKEMEKIHPGCEDNYLFKVPFDGELGYENKERNGYGAGYGTHKTVDEIYLNKWLELEEITGGLLDYRYDVEKIEEFGKTREGVILDIDKDGTFNFTPSKALGLKAELGTGKSGLFYDLINGPKEAKKRIGIDKDYEKGLKYLFNWTAGQDEIQKESQLDKEDKECSAERFGIIFKDSDKTVQKVLSFVPVKWKDAGYTFAKQCNKGIKEFTAYEFDHEGDLVDTHDSTFSSRVPSDIRKETSIAKWIADIKTEKVCVTSSDSKFTLEWNKEKLMQELN